MDETIPLLNYICRKEGLYPANNEEAYKADRLISVIFNCRIDSSYPETLSLKTISEKVAFMTNKCLKIVPAYL